MKFRKAGSDNGAHAAIVKSGTHAPDKDASSKAKVAKAADSKKGGSFGAAKALPTENKTPNQTPVSSDPKATNDVKRYEGSSQDWSQDYASAKRMGMTPSQYEDTPRDRIQDAAGERRMRAEDSNTDEYSPQASSSYKRGTPAFGNSPKNAHGFGHPTSARDGHLRNSGHSGAHRIGHKK